MGNKSKYQKFEVETVKREVIKNADYNPRVIDDEARKRLKKAIKTVGLVEPIIVNKRTMNIVGGHQRLSVLDSLHKTGDFDLDVSLIDVDEREEKRINIMLNNLSMQGEYDPLKLKLMFEAENFEFDELGFTIEDLNIMEIEAGDLFENKETKEEKNERDEIEKIKEIKKAKKDFLLQQNLKDNRNYFFAVVFEDEDTKRKWMREKGLDELELYISYKTIDALLSRQK